MYRKHWNSAIGILFFLIYVGAYICLLSLGTGSAGARISGMTAAMSGIFLLL